MHIDLIGPWCEMKVFVALILSLSLICKSFAATSCFVSADDVADMHLAAPNSLPGCKNDHQIEDREPVCKYCHEPRLTLNGVVSRLCDVNALPPSKELSTLLKFVKLSSQSLPPAASSLLQDELNDCKLMERIVNNYDSNVVGKVAAMRALPWSTIFRPFASSLEAMNPSHVLYDRYKQVCQTLVQVMIERYRFFSIDAMSVTLRMDPYRDFLRQALFGLLHMRQFEYADLSQLISDDPYWELAHGRMFEVLLLAIKRYGIPFQTKLLRTQYGPEKLSLKDYCAVNPFLAELL